MSAEDTFYHLPDSPVVCSVASAEGDPEMAPRPQGAGKVQIGDLYRTKGRRTGYWLVIAIRDEGPITGKICVCVGLSMSFEIVTACTYGYHYFEKKNPSGWIDMSKTALTN